MRRRFEILQREEDMIEEIEDSNEDEDDILESGKRDREVEGVALSSASQENVSPNNGRHLKRRRRQEPSPSLSLSSSPLTATVPDNTPPLSLSLSLPQDEEEEHEEEQQDPQAPQPAHLLAMIDFAQNRIPVVNAALLLRQAGCQFYHPSSDDLISGQFLSRIPALMHDRAGVFVLPQSAFNNWSLGRYQWTKNLLQRIKLQCGGLKQWSKKFDLLIRQPGADGTYCLLNVIKLDERALNIPDRRDQDDNVTNAQKQAGYLFDTVAKGKQDNAAACLSGLPEVEHRFIFDVSELDLSRKQALWKVIDTVVKLKLLEANHGAPKFQLMCRTHEGKIVLTEIYDLNDAHTFAQLRDELAQYFHFRRGDMMNFEMRYETLLDIVSIWPCVKDDANLHFVFKLTRNVLDWNQKLCANIKRALIAETNQDGRALFRLNRDLTEAEILQYFPFGQTKPMAKLYNKVRASTAVLRNNCQLLSQWVQMDNQLQQTQSHVGYLYNVLHQHQVSLDDVSQDSMLSEGSSTTFFQRVLHFSESPFSEQAAAYDQCIESCTALSERKTELRQQWRGDPQEQQPADENAGGNQRAF